MTDIAGLAIKEHYYKQSKSKLWTYDQFGPRVEMPVSIYFRQEEDFPLLEKVALQNCQGSVLDIGAGAGAHSLYLQENGKNITALDISGNCVEVMRDRGVRNVLRGDFFEMDLPQYDTLLLLMNGIGICGKLENVSVFLEKAKTLLNPDGKIIFDSSDVSYMYEDISFPENYYGEISYRYDYKKWKTDWFTWLYVDVKTISNIAAENGWEMSVLLEDENSQYVATLTLKK